jgi:hypothetical protein
LNLASPEWLILLAVNSVLFFQEFQKGNERLVWNEAETHAIIDNELLGVAGKSITSADLNIL